jgi:hypothetical protein
MSSAANNINAQIDEYVRNQGLTAFQNLNLNRILHLIVALADANSGTSQGSSNIMPITSANFINATQCPIPAMDGIPIRIYWDEGAKFLETDNADWQVYPGGGFTVLIPGFDSTKGNYHFYVFKSTN